MNKHRHMCKALVAMAGLSDRSKAINAWEDSINLGGPRVRGKNKPRERQPSDNVNDWRHFVGPAIREEWKPNG